MAAGRSHAPVRLARRRALLRAPLLPLLLLLLPAALPAVRAQGIDQICPLQNECASLLDAAAAGSGEVQPRAVMPGNRSFHVAVDVPDGLLIHGGLLSAALVADFTVFSDLWLYHAILNRFFLRSPGRCSCTDKAQATLDLPCGRAAHTATVTRVGASNLMVTVGGFGGVIGHALNFDGLLVWSIDQHRYFPTQQVGGVAFPARFGHTTVAAPSRGRLFIFGGVYWVSPNSAVLNETAFRPLTLYVLDLGVQPNPSTSAAGPPLTVTYTWSVLEGVLPITLPRAFMFSSLLHASNLRGDSVEAVFGGGYQGTLLSSNATWCALRMQDRNVTSLGCRGDGPPVAYAAATPVRSRVRMFGGTFFPKGFESVVRLQFEIDNTQSSDVLWELNPGAATTLADYEWHRVTSGINREFGRILPRLGGVYQLPPARLGTTFTTHGAVSLLWGGTNPFGWSYFGNGATSMFAIQTAPVEEVTPIWFTADVFDSTRPNHRNAGAAVAAAVPPGHRADGGPLGGSLLTLFGGYGIQQQQVGEVWQYVSCNRLWRYDVPSDTANVTASNPSARASHTMTLVGGAAYIFGGLGFTVKGVALYHNDLWRLDPLSGYTARINPQQTTGAPTPRSHHSAVEMRGGLVIFGGRNQTAALASLWRWTGAAGWVRLPDAPLSLWGHAAASLPLGGEAMVVFGGLVDRLRYTQADDINRQMLRFEAGTQTWAFLHPSVLPSPRYSPVVISLPTKMIINDGIGPNYMARRDAWVYDEALGDWEQLHGQLDHDHTILPAATGFPSTYEDATPLVGIFGGLSPAGLPLDSLIIHPLGCNPGSFSARFAHESCVACPLGTYAPSYSAKCQSCPTGTSTLTVGASSRDDCTLCAAGTCLHGRCNVVNFKPHCACSFGYTGNQCEAVSVGLIVLVTILSGLTVLSVLGWLTLRARNETLQHKLVQRLLDESEYELNEWRRAWEVDPNDLKLLDPIAAGSYGQVYLGHWQGLQVAVKTLKDCPLFDDNLEETRFAQEIEFVCTLRHRNIVHYYGAGRFADGKSFLVAQYCDRGSLRSLLDDPAVDVSWPLVHKFSTGIAEGLEFLHSKKRLHRDLKAANVLVTDDFEAKITDFGTSRQLESKEATTPRPRGRLLLRQASGQPEEVQMTAEAGTLPFMAPELFSDTNIYYDRADVYSLGVLFWEIRTRDVPFQTATSPFEIKRRVLEGERPALPASGSDVPTEYDDLIRACWSTTPQDRPLVAQIIHTLSTLAPSQP